MKYTYLPSAEGTSDFFILGSKTGFAAMVLLAIFAAVIIIKFILKNKK